MLVTNDIATSSITTSSGNISSTSGNIQTRDGTVGGKNGSFFKICLLLGCKM